GSRETNVATFPYRHPSGFVGIRAIDEAGNPGPITTARIYDSPERNDPYVVSEGQSAPLSVGGTPLGLMADDEYKTYTLPFEFPFKGIPSNTVIVSTNGTIYPLGPPYRPSSKPEDALSSAGQLNLYNMIAGL